MCVGFSTPNNSAVHKTAFVDECGFFVLQACLCQKLYFAVTVKLRGSPYTSYGLHVELLAIP